MFPSTFHYATRPSDAPVRRGRSGRIHVADDGAPVTIRLAERAEPAVDRLAQLDGVLELPAGPRLVAEVGGRPVAALALETGVAVADPFERSAAFVELLRVRAAQLQAAA